MHQYTEIKSPRESKQLFFWNLKNKHTFYINNHSQNISLGKCKSQIPSCLCVLVTPSFSQTATISPFSLWHAFWTPFKGASFCGKLSQPLQNWNLWKIGLWIWVSKYMPYCSFPPQSKYFILNLRHFMAFYKTFRCNKYFHNEKLFKVVITCYLHHATFHLGIHLQLH